MTDPPLLPQPEQAPAGGTHRVHAAEEGWQHLHPLSPLVRVGAAVTALLLVVIERASGSRSGPEIFIYIGALGLILILSIIRWLVTRWRIEDGVLRIESGLLRRTSRRFPPEQMQAVDTVRPAIARILGLAEVRVRMAASTGSSGRIAYLRDAEAEAVRARLLAIAHGVEEHAPPPPERVLFTVPTPPLIASILLSGPALVLEAVIVGLALLAVFAHSALGPAVSGSATALFALGTGVFRRFSSEFELTVAEAPDGLRLRGGLLQTAAETIPYGRVQAARLVEPVLWRPFGWCRLLVDVAGKQRSGRENRQVAGTLRAVLPVGSRDQATWLLGRVLPAVPELGAHPPARARWKSPLRYHYLTWNRSQWYAVTTSGRLQRVTDFVPLAKVQSIRRVEGPVQRRFRLATVHLDTAGRGIRSAARDRDRSECARLVDELPAACRAARLASARR